MTQTKTQWIYADKNPRVDRVLGSSSVHAGSRLFIEGDYTFPSEETMQPGYIEARNVSFNGTNRSTVGGMGGTSGVRASGGSSSRRRNAQLKQSPTRGGHTASYPTHQDGELEPSINGNLVSLMLREKDRYHVVCTCGMRQRQIYLAAM